MIRKIVILTISVLAILVAVGASRVSAQSTETARTSDTSISNSQPDICVMSFSDVPQGSTFYQYIYCLYCRGVIDGYQDGTFRPNNNVTRGQLSKIVAVSAGFNNPPGSQLFEDVLPASTYYTYVNQLTEFGYVNGYDCGGPGEPCSPQMYRYFRPGAPATRGQIAKIVSQSAGWFDPAGTQVFEDVAPGSTFYDYIQRLYGHNAIAGYPCGGPGEPCNLPGNRPYFRPNNLTTRGQLSKIDVYAFFPGCLVSNK
jgi:S-layer homology domain